MGTRNIIALAFAGAAIFYGSIVGIISKSVRDTHDMVVYHEGQLRKLQDVSTEERKILDNTMDSHFPELVGSGRLRSSYSFLGNYSFKSNELSKDSLETIACEVVCNSGLDVQRATYFPLPL